MSSFNTHIVSPAGNVEKMRFAIAYGADAVYFGGEAFNLRVQAGNLKSNDLEEAAYLCKKNNVTSVFLMNAFLHESDLACAEDYIRTMLPYNFDAIMVSDPGLLLLLRESGFSGKIHLSTQMNTLNHSAIKFWKQNGISRIVLGREVTLDEIRLIKDNTDIEIEIFAHGALCIAYSGRCLLSRYLSGRDANQGDCSQPCRWNYSLIEEKRQGNHLDIIEYANGTEILSSKDLCILPKLESYINAGVKAFKIEGRMKSVYHAANTTRIYKHALSCAGTDAFRKFLPFWLEELDLISHRPYTDNLFQEFDNLVFEGIPYINKAVFLGYKIQAGSANARVLARLFNPLKTGDRLNVIYPILDNIIRDHYAEVLSIYDESGNRAEKAGPGKVWELELDHPIEDNAIFRKKLTA